MNLPKHKCWFSLRSAANRQCETQPAYYSYRPRHLFFLRCKKIRLMIHLCQINYTQSYSGAHSLSDRSAWTVMTHVEVTLQPKIIMSENLGQS